MCNCGLPIARNGFNIHAMLKTDPTRTLTIRRKFESDLVKRFKKVRKDIITSIDANDCFGLKDEVHTIQDILLIQEAVPKKQFVFERNSDKVNAFMQWLNEQVNNEILEIHDWQQIGEAIEKAWTNKYIQTAYQKGIVRGRQELRNKGYAVPDVDDLFQGVSAAFNQPFHLDRVGLVYTRTFRGLKGITDEMDKQISQILAQGLADGMNPKVLAKSISSVFEIVDGFDKATGMRSITRAKVLARTEVIRAHHLATIQEYKNWGAEGVEVLAEWSTAGDNRVCPICSDLQGRVYSIAKIEGMIPRHPQCRCIALPLDVTDNPNFKRMIEELENV